MLYLLYGKAVHEAKQKANELLSTLQKKKPDASVFRLEGEKFSYATFDELIGGQGLFEQKYVVYCSQLFENKEAKEYVLEKIKEVAASENIFIFVEDALDKATLSKFEKYAAKIQHFEKEEDRSSRSKEFNIFSLTDAFGRRDKKNLWVLYQKAKTVSVEPEEIHGILFWQLKALLSASESSNAKESGLAPFVFSKAQGFLKNFSNEELVMLSSKLVALYSKARRGRVDFYLGLERFILEL